MATVLVKARICIIVTSIRCTVLSSHSTNSKSHLSTKGILSLHDCVIMNEPIRFQVRNVYFIAQMEFFFLKHFMLNAKDTHIATANVTAYPK